MFTNTQILNPCHFPAVLQVEKISMNLRHLTARPGRSQRLVRTSRRVGSQKLWIYHDLPPRSLGIICLWKKTWWPTILTFGDGMGWRAGTSMVFFPPLPVQFSHRYQLVVKTCQNPGAVFTLKKTWDLWLLIPSNSSSSFDGAWFFCSCFLWSKRCSCGNCRSKKHKKGSTENTGYPLK